MWSAIKKIFSLSGEDEEELQRLREKHGINTAPREEVLKEIKNDPGAKEYDVWEDIRNYRSTRVTGSIPPETSVPFDFIDVVEVDDLDTYLRDLDHHPAVEEVHSQSERMVEVLHCVVAETVPQI